MALMHEDFFTLGGIFTLAGFVVEEFYCKCVDTANRFGHTDSALALFNLDIRIASIIHVGETDTALSRLQSLDFLPRAPFG